MSSNERTSLPDLKPWPGIHRISPVSLAVFSILVGLLVFGLPSPSRTRAGFTLEDLKAMIGQGRYAPALESVNFEASRTPGDSPWNILADFLKKELKATLDFHFGNPYDSKSTGGKNPLPSGVALTSADPYWLEAETFEKCFLYVFQKDSSGRLVQLFPGPNHAEVKNPVSPERFRLPKPGWSFFLDNIPGTETVYAAAFRWEFNELAELCDQPSPEEMSFLGEQKAARILACLDRVKTSRRLVPGLFYSEFQFSHVGR